MQQAKKNIFYIGIKGVNLPGFALAEVSLEGKRNQLLREKRRVKMKNFNKKKEKFL